MSQTVTAPDTAPETTPEVNLAEDAACSTGWPLERALFLMAGTMTLLSAILAATVSPWFLLLAGFVAVNQLLYVGVHNCGASLMLKRFAGLKSVIYPTR